MHGLELLFLGYKIEISVAPQILVSIGHQQHTFGIQGFDGTLVVGDQNNCAFILGDGFKNLVP